MLRTLAAVAITLGTLTASSCSSHADATAPVFPATGWLTFRLDANTCLGSQVELFIDGKSQGAWNMTPGGDKTFLLNAGNYVASAKETRTLGLSWPAWNVYVPANVNQLSLLRCS